MKWMILTKQIRVDLDKDKADSTVIYSLKAIVYEHEKALGEINMAEQTSRNKVNMGGLSSLI